MGFISGSLGVVWPWKKTIYKQNHLGELLTDSRGDYIIENYERFIPEFNSTETLYAIVFIFVGVGIVLSLEWYGKRQKKLV
jgi:hypothetical protein